MTLKGSVKSSSGGNVQVSLGFSGKGSVGTTKYAESLTYLITVDPSTGTITGQKTGTASKSGHTPIKLLPPLTISDSLPPLDWSLSITPATNGTKVTGTATVDLASGRSFPFTVSGTTAKLTLTGTGTGKGAKLTVTMSGQHITGITGSLLGQKVNLTGL